MYNNILKNYFKDIDSKLIEPLTILDREYYQAISSRMNVLIEKIIQNDNAWLESKVKEFLNSAKTQTKETFSALLGEVRAYGEILDTFYGCSVSHPKQGSDFILEIKKQKVNIEINTPQETSNGKDTEYKEEYKNINISDKVALTSISSKAPFGYPTRAKDNIQYEAVCKFASIKKNKDKNNNKEHKQFTEEDISILWLDMNDPTLFTFDLGDERQPLKAFNGAVSSGVLWYAFYGQKDDWIYASYDGMYSRDAVQMEFDGRFQSGSNIDFVIVDAFTKKYILQNPYSRKDIPKELYNYFLNLFGVQISQSFFDFELDRLKDRINSERERNNMFFERLITHEDESYE